MTCRKIKCDAISLKKLKRRRSFFTVFRVIGTTIKISNCFLKDFHKKCEFLFNTNFKMNMNIIYPKIKITKELIYFCLQT